MCVENITEENKMHHECKKCDAGLCFELYHALLTLLNIL